MSSGKAAYLAELVAALERDRHVGGVLDESPDEEVANSLAVDTTVAVRLLGCSSGGIGGTDGLGRRHCGGHGRRQDGLGDGGNEGVNHAGRGGRRRRECGGDRIPSRCAGAATGGDSVDRNNSYDLRKCHPDRAGAIWIARGATQVVIAGLSRC